MEQKVDLPMAMDCAPETSGNLVTIYRGQQTTVPMDPGNRDHHFWTTSLSQAENYARHTAKGEPVAVYSAQIEIEFLEERASVENWDRKEHLDCRLLNSEIHREIRRIW